MTVNKGLADDLKHWQNGHNRTKERLAGMDRLIAPTLIALDLAIGDGFRSKAEGPRSGISDPVGASIEQVADILELGQLLNMQRAILWIQAESLLNTMRRIIEITASTPIGASVKAATCTLAVGMPGVAEWAGDATTGEIPRCDDLIHSDGLCARHWAARRRWMMAAKEGREYRRRKAG